MSSRKRLSPQESRTAALEAARGLLIETGPQSVTLKAVANRIGRTHANLLHHFGSASGLQKALAAHLAQTVCDTIAESVRAARAGVADPGETVDLAFDAFDREGGGALAGWMLASGNEDALDPIVETIHALVDELHPQVADCAPGHDDVAHRSTLIIVLLALGHSLMGRELAKSLKLPEDTARLTAKTLLEASLANAKATAS
ncbi:TetR family transcriptional regulator [Qipengyuania sp. JC766]|uniref:TetR/AcrR family transcriptional regulator n=1 Tax=Qipengyuania sp. JC766 TaxID=3232139 RepID=UPI0034575A6D